jgi:hypothetical protein
MTRTTRREDSTDPWLIVTAVLAVVLLFLVGVGALWLLGSGEDETAASPTPSPSASAPAASPTPSTEASAEASGSVEPSGAASPSPAASTEPPASAGPSASPSASPSPDATGCSGSEENQVFFAQAAETLAFEVYCADLPSGWSLVSAGYRSAGGGKLEISYKGPGGATLVLRQGPAACTDVEACPPTGVELGAASFGDRSGTLLDTDAGFAVDATDGATLYLAETTVVDRDTTTALTSALVPIR